MLPVEAELALLLSVTQRTLSCSNWGHTGFQADPQALTTKKPALVSSMERTLDKEWPWPSRVTSRAFSFLFLEEGGEVGWVFIFTRNTRNNVCLSVSWNQAVLWRPFRNKEVKAKAQAWVVPPPSQTQKSHSHQCYTLDCCVRFHFDKGFYFSQKLCIKTTRLGHLEPWSFLHLCSKHSANEEMGVKVFCKLQRGMQILSIVIRILLPGEIFCLPASRQFSEGQRLFAPMPQMTHFKLTW